MCTRWILVLIIRDTNKIACWPTIRSRNGWGARNLLYFLSFSSIEQQRVYRSFPSFASPPSASLFLPSVFIFTPLSPLRRGDPPPLIYLPPRIQASRLVYVAIRLFCSYKYLMPFPKVTPNRRGKMYLISLSLSFPFPARYSRDPSTDVNPTNSLGHCISKYLHFIASSETLAI